MKFTRWLKNCLEVFAAKRAKTGGHRIVRENKHAKDSFNDSDMHWLGIHASGFGR
jgi:hypothetical protein